MRRHASLEATCHTLTDARRQISPLSDVRGCDAVLSSAWPRRRRVIRAALPHASAAEPPPRRRAPPPAARHARRCCIRLMHAPDDCRADFARPPPRSLRDHRHAFARQRHAAPIRPPPFRRRQAPSLLGLLGRRRPVRVVAAAVARKTHASPRRRHAAAYSPGAPTPPPIFAQPRHARAPRYARAAVRRAMPRPSISPGIITAR